MLDKITNLAKRAVSEDGAMTLELDLSLGSFVPRNGKIQVWDGTAVPVDRTEIPFIVKSIQVDESTYGFHVFAFSDGWRPMPNSAFAEELGMSVEELEARVEALRRQPGPKGLEQQNPPSVQEVQNL